MATIAQRELRNDNAKVMDAVQAGETFAVTRNGEPVAELRPLRSGRRRYLTRAELAGVARANVRIDRDRFRTDLDDMIGQGGSSTSEASTYRAVVGAARSFWKKRADSV